ncbi:MAG: hypothetical protein KGJ80_22090, partial [Chloroflexota bacterium]|nr:hypothetical protein [Chloroflexota bacterium]
MKQLHPTRLLRVLDMILLLALTINPFAPVSAAYIQDVRNADPARRARSSEETEPIGRVLPSDINRSLAAVTGTITPTATLTPTFTATATKTLTATAPASVTPKPSATITPTATATPSRTFTPSITSTASSTRAPSASLTRTPTTTASATV